MRVPIALEARPSRIWRGAVLAAGLLALATIGAWSVTAADNVDGVWRAGVVLAALIVVVSAVRGAFAPPAGLRWTGATWELLPPGAIEPLRGRARVAIDLGAWLLVRFVADGARRVHWVPVERRGDAAAWHALRSALYAAGGGAR